MQNGFPDVFLFSTSSPSSSVAHAFPSSRSMEKHNFQNVLFNMVQGYHVQLRCHLPLFHTFKLVNIEATTVHHPVIQREVDELLAKCAIDPPDTGADFC